MKYCNCRATRMYDLSTRYIVDLDFLQTDVSIEMVWDTGASKTVIYSPYLKKLKGLGKVRAVGLESYLSQEAQSNGVSHSFSDKYVQLPFAIANGQYITGILCCISDILIKGFQLKNLNRNFQLENPKDLRLEKFYFYLVHTTCVDIPCLLGTDFISCCERSCFINSDEIFTKFDEKLYEENIKLLCKSKGKEVFNLKFLANVDSNESIIQDSIKDVESASKVHAFL